MATEVWGLFPYSKIKALSILNQAEIYISIKSEVPTVIPVLPLECIADFSQDRTGIGGFHSCVFLYSHKIPPDSERHLSASWLNINSDWRGGKFWQMAKPLGLACVKIHPGAAQCFAKVHLKGGQLTADINWQSDTFGTQEINNLWQAWGGSNHETCRKRSLTFYSASPCNLSSTMTNHLLFVHIQISKLKISAEI